MDHNAPCTDDPQARPRRGRAAVALRERNLAKITSDEFPGEWLIVCRNPLLADERHRKRQELIAATEREREKIAVATCRERRPLRGMDTIGTRVGKVINRYRVANHFVTTISEEAFTYECDLEKIAIEEALDGIYVVRSNVDPDRLDAAETVRTYKILSGIEYAFRSLKTIDLEVRSIYHRREHRVRAHILLCMLAYYVEWHMRKALAPVLFDAPDPAAGEAQRSAPVDPARRTPAARRKAGRKRTDSPV
ncbi:MAG: transposase [Gammaproteobacteria bacterium]|nr:transposase [Gammaproteobacteria bacterium]